MGGALNHYATLKVAPDADAEVIRAAYKALMLKHHPDRNAESVTALSRTKEITEAFAVLGDPEKRSAYDLTSARGAGGSSFQDFGAAMRAAAEEEAHNAEPEGHAFGPGSPRGPGPPERPAFYRRTVRDLAWTPAPRKPFKPALAAAAAGFAVIAALTGGIHGFRTPNEPAAVLHAESVGRPMVPPLNAETRLTDVERRLSALNGEAPEAGPKLIRVRRQANLDGSRGLFGLPEVVSQAWAALTAPQFSRATMGGAVTYRRSDPWSWFGDAHRKVAEPKRRPSPKRSAAHS